MRRKQLWPARQVAARISPASTTSRQVGGRSRVADGVLAGGGRPCRRAGGGLAVIAMGKHGAQELNYASDVDIMFVGADGAEVDPARALVSPSPAGRSASTPNLRPEGRNGALVRSLDSFVAYWERWASPWEFQALLKARQAAGDPELGAAFETAAADALWARRLDADDLAELRTMKAAPKSSSPAKGLADREIKRGRGGIRDIEFSVQLLQLVHGAGDPALRLPATLPAPRRAGRRPATSPRRTRLPWRLPTASCARSSTGSSSSRRRRSTPSRATPRPRERLASVLGFPGPSRTEAPARERLDAVLGRYQAPARAIHERLFFRPLLEVFAGEGGAGRASGPWRPPRAARGARLPPRRTAPARPSASSPGVSPAPRD